MSMAHAFDYTAGLSSLRRVQSHALRFVLSSYSACGPHSEITKDYRLEGRGGGGSSGQGINGRC